jgi:Galactose oxidase, central domain
LYRCLLSLLLTVIVALLPAAVEALGVDDSRTADECRAKVNAHFDALAAPTDSVGNDRGSGVATNRHRSNALGACDQMERRQQDQRMRIAYRRLGEQMDLLVADVKPTPEAQGLIADDLAAIRSFKPAPYRDAYLQLHAEYVLLVVQGPTQAQRKAPRHAPPVEPLVPNPGLGAPEGTAGRLRPWGTYLGTEAGQTTTLLRDGGVLLVGHGHTRPDSDDPAVVSRALRERRGSAWIGAIELRPRKWDSSMRGWRRLPEMPECPKGSRALHTVTELPDSNVLIAGGLCDLPKLADDPAPHAAFTATSLWDAQTGRWVAAPALREQRLDHSATLLADGSVLFVGGRSDPALGSATGEGVLNSVEQYHQGRMLSAPPLVTARAGHTATVMADGSVMVLGGFDREGRALKSAERWALGDPAWRDVAGPRFPRHGHTATRLADGRVLIAGGVGTDGRRLTAVEFWEPETQQWLAAPSLPVPLSGHAATLLSDGRVLVAGGARLGASGSVPWAWVWQPGESEWQVAGRIENNLARSNTDTVTVTARDDGGAIVLTSSSIMRWEPRPVPDAVAPPIWLTAPAASLLPDGRVIFVGTVEADVGDSQSAYLWNPQGNLWQAAGRLAGTARRSAAMLTLPSGRVLRAALDGDDRFVCDRWESNGNDWRPCGSASPQYTVDRDFSAGLMEDGRAVVLVNRLEALVFDERTDTWAVWQPEWSTESLPYGTPIRSTSPLARVRDPADGRWFEINDVAARWRQSRESQLSMLWDPQAKHWTYITLGKMGRDPVRLPDGCVISANPLSLFDPTTGQSTLLIDPGLGIDQGQRRMVVLPDGGVVIVGPPGAVRDPGAGFFRSRASCNGIELLASDAGYVAGGLAVDAPPARAQAASAPQTPARPWHRAAAHGVAEHRWLLLAIGGPILGWLLLRRTRLARVQVGPAWVLRTLVYGAALLWLVPAAWSYFRFSAHRDELDCRYDPSCASDTFAESGTIPCRLVGVWSSRRGQVMRRIELKDDGTYVMAPSESGVDPRGGYEGRWKVEGQSIVWLHKGVGDRDVNPMKVDGPGRFTLVETNGANTKFELIRAVASDRCNP